MVEVMASRRWVTVIACISHYNPIGQEVTTIHGNTTIPLVKRLLLYMAILQSHWSRGYYYTWQYYNPIGQEVTRIPLFSGVMTIDDDRIIAHDDLVFGFRVWQVILYLCYLFPANSKS